MEQNSHLQYNTEAKLCLCPDSTSTDANFFKSTQIQALNMFKVKNGYPLPHIDYLNDEITGTTKFYSLDLAQGSHQIRMSLEDPPKLHFTTPFGHCQLRVLCF